MIRRTAITNIAALGPSGCAVGEGFTMPTMKTFKRFSKTLSGLPRTNGAKVWQVQRKKAVTVSEIVLDIARERFADGTVSFLQVLDAERSFLNTENAYAYDVRNLAIDFVDLNVALGGSFGRN